MWNFINRNYWNVVIVSAVVLALICSVAVIARGDGTEASGLTNVVNVIVTPIKSVFGAVTGGIGDFFEDLSQSKSAVKENKQLKKQIKQLENENERLDELKNENDRLRKMLDLKDRQDNYTTVACEVVGRSFSTWNNEFVVNKGTADGIDVGNVVTDSGGLVGSVTMAGTNWARVTTVLDSYSSVSANVIRSGECGIVEGDIKLASSGECAFNYTVKDADISIGDTLETSGLGNMYPKGIIIGKVKTVEAVSGQITKKITVDVAVDIYNLKEVTVITSF